MEDNPSSRLPSGWPVELPTILAPGGWDWQVALGDVSRETLAGALAKSITTRRWFGAKARTLRDLEIVDAVAVTSDARLVLVRVEYLQGPAEVYQIPLAFAAGSEAQRLLSAEPASLWARVQLADRSEMAVLYDPLDDAAFSAALLGLFDTQARLPGVFGRLVARQSGAFGTLRGDAQRSLQAKLLQVEQSNSSIAYGERLVLKLFRRVEMGLNPDLEINDHLTKRGFAHVPPLAGALEYCRAGHEPWALAMLQGFVFNQGDAWRTTLGWLQRFLAQATTGRANLPDVWPLPDDGMYAAAERPLPAAVTRAFDRFLASAQRLGTRTAELHLTLAAETDDPAFAPEPFTAADQRRFVQQAHDLAGETFGQLRAALAQLTETVRPRAAAVLPLEAVASEASRSFADTPVQVAKIRCHGDYHLGQVLVADDDFVILDFEGEPARPLAERRQKQVALRDVAGMIRSFHYASRAAANAAKQQTAEAGVGPIDAWAGAWYFWTSVAFLAAYRSAAAGSVFLPSAPAEIQRLLDAYLLEKALYELRYELNNRPDWVALPLEALVGLLSNPAAP
jgi:maltose alpha-D-glucosyltransferase/alpha-amylase